MDALIRLLTEKEASCLFHSLITGYVDADDPYPLPLNQLEVEEDRAEPASPGDIYENLNPSQRAAVHACGAPLSLIWGPPGTFQTSTSHSRVYSPYGGIV